MTQPVFTFRLVGAITLQFPVPPVVTYFIKYDLSFLFEEQPGIQYTLFANTTNGVLISPGATFLVNGDFTNFQIVSLDDGGLGSIWTTGGDNAANGPWRVPPQTGEAATCSFPTAWTNYTRNNALIGTSYSTIDDAMAAINGQIVDGGSAGTYINSDSSTSTILWDQNASSDAVDAEITSEGSLSSFVINWGANYTDGHASWPCRYSQPVGA